MGQPPPDPLLKVGERTLPLDAQGGIKGGLEVEAGRRNTAHHLNHSSQLAGGKSQFQSLRTATPMPTDAMIRQPIRHVMSFLTRSRSALVA